MDKLVEYKFYYSERNEISHITDKTLKEYAQKKTKESLVYRV